MNYKQFDCRLCGKSPHEHGEPGASSLGGSNDRPCPCDSYESAVTSQFYTPKVEMYLNAIRDDLRAIQQKVANALAWINEVIDQ